MNEITLDDIKSLSDIQLSELLNKLLVLEATKYELEGWEHSVPLNITTGDEGSDGKIRWSGALGGSPYLKNQFTIFQNKATKLNPASCYEEILKTEKKGDVKRTLKGEINELVEGNGCYILFTNIPIVDKGKKSRIAEFRKAIKDAGHPNHATFEIEVYDANKIKEWCNTYVATVTQVQGFRGVSRPHHFITWDKWAIQSKAGENKFQKDSTVSGNEKLIEESIKSEKVIRVTGHSGLGKTRLVLEAFRDSDIRESIVYYDLAGILDISNIKGYIISHQDTQSGTIIVDNCDVKWHNILSAIVKPSGDIRLITIGLDDSTAVEDLKIKIEREKQRNLIEQIVEEKIGTTHSISDKTYITTISEGYPWMAIRFCDIVIKEGMKDLSKIHIDEFIKKLIFGSSSENEIEYNIIRACSVFSSFGFLDDSFRDILSKELIVTLKSQMDFIRTRIYEGEITEIKFNETCRKFLKEDIIEQRGAYYVVKPTILAIGLASDWLINTDSERIIKIIEDLREVKLEEKFLDRLKDLDQIDKAKDIVAELWGGANSPFGTAEVLNTSWGSLLFRYVVEVNPVVTANALFDAFGNKDVDELKLIDHGRRNLVWALEKLCFRKETFHKASRIMYAFAVAENESWGNNATNQFVHLFQIFLAGTEVTLKERIEIIKWGFAKKEDEYVKIGLQALGRGLQNHHFSRMGTADRQGSGVPLKDFQPTNEEILEYHCEILSILKGIACSQNPFVNNARKIIANSIRELLSHEEIEILSVVKEVMAFSDETWLDARQGLKDALHFEKHLSEETIMEITSLIEALTPTDVKNQLLLKVSKPQWSEFSKDERGEYIDIPKINAIAYAKLLFESNVEWQKYIPLLVVGEQRQAFNFGNEIGSLFKEAEMIVKVAIDSLKSIDVNEQNVEFVIGVLIGANNKKLKQDIVKKMTADENLRQHVFSIIRASYESLSDLNDLFLLVDEHAYSVEHFKGFMYGRVLEKLSNDEVVILCKRIEKYGDAGLWTALSLMFMYCFGNAELNHKNRAWFKNIIIGTNMLLSVHSLKSRPEGYHWSETVSRLLNGTGDDELARVVAKQIVEFCGNKNYSYGFENDVKKILILLVSQYFDIVWSLIGDALIGDYLTFFNMKNLIGVKNGNLVPRRSILFSDSKHDEAILTWCRQHKEIAPERIANMMPLSIKKDGEVTWHPFSEALIEEFGGNKKVLDNLASNMGTFGSSGSSVPYYETQKKLVEILLVNNNAVVREWASEMLNYTNKAIKKEKFDDDQQYIV